MNISASELVKCSASQLLYKAIKKIPNKPTKRQFKGNKYADKIVKKHKASSEKRGVVPIGNDLLFFCVDLVKGDRFVEIKMVENPKTFERWYLESSVLQSTFYASLLTKVKTLDTPLFRKKEGYSQEIITVPSSFKFELWFGDTKYSITPNKTIYDFYMMKNAVVISSIPNKNFDHCRKFDAKYKHKEFQLLKPNYELIKTFQPQLF